MMPPVRPPRARRAFTLVEMMVAMGVFVVAFLGMWECIRTTFFLAAKNTGLNLSHSALQESVDTLANQIRASLQVVDVANFDGTTFTHVDETATPGASASGNAVRFLRLLPVTIFMLPDDGSPYTETNPQNPQSLQYPDYLTPTNRTIRVVYNTGTTNTSDPSFAADLQAARVFPLFPYLSETNPAGSNQGTMPGLAISSYLASSTTSATILLVNGWPSTPPVPSCNQAYLVIVSAMAVLNRGTHNSELMYYPDATNVARSHSLSTALNISTTGSGPAVFALPRTAGSASDPGARASLDITLPVYSPDLNNTVFRRGGTAALTNVSLSIPVELRRRATF